MKKIKNVITECAKKGLCSGCGICAGVAEKCDLKIEFNKYGEFFPTVSKCDNCGLCLFVCPSLHVQVRKESNILSLLGKDIECFAGYSKVDNERAKGSSGGLTTRVLKMLLEKKIITGAIAIGKCNNEDRMFDPIIAKTNQEIDSCAGSKYYPVEFSSVLKRLKQEDGEYAIVGLPCVINGLRLVQQKYPVVGIKIKYLFGLVCGHNKNKNYTSFLIKTTGVNEKDAETVFFRCKTNTKKAMNYGFKVILKNGKEGRQLNFQDSLVKNAWCGRYFSLNACFHCRDLFAEQADVSFMDAWLKSYMDKPLGTSIIVVRNEELKKMIQEENNKGNVEIDTIIKNDVIMSQKGALDFKQSEISKKCELLFNQRLSNLYYHDKAYLKSLRFFFLKSYISLHWFIMKIKAILN
ncbi:MAG: Coenzyme F420 hydrogenase/dehydrogenase, beta subunit C-terminal domain [Candidatus Omnitrophota bacterium]